MKAREVVKEIMANQSLTNAGLANRVGISREAAWDRINTKKAKDMAVDTLLEMLKVMDYKIQIVPRSSRLPDGGYEVD